MCPALGDPINTTQPTAAGLLQVLRGVRAQRPSALRALADVCEPLHNSTSAGTMAELACEAGLLELLPRALQAITASGTEYCVVAMARLLCEWPLCCWGGDVIKCCCRLLCMCMSLHAGAHSGS